MVTGPREDEDDDVRNVVRAHHPGERLLWPASSRFEREVRGDPARADIRAPDAANTRSTVPRDSTATPGIVAIRVESFAVIPGARCARRVSSTCDANCRTATLVRPRREIARTDVSTAVSEGVARHGGGGVSRGT